MDDWFGIIASGSELPVQAAQDLRDAGFVVIPGPVATDGLGRLVEAYDSAFSSAVPDDVSIGSSTTRVHDYVNRGPEFDSLYVHRPLLEACCHLLGRPFKLSTLLGRTLRPRSPAGDLHVDSEPDESGWTMLGFILMVDEFRSDNGATRFVPGSHNWSGIPASLMTDRKADHEGQVLACGPAGSLIVYNGSVWHGHTANPSGEPRRSIQGSYIRRDGRSGLDLPARMRPETLSRISPLAKYLLSV
jgi:hypothetical protein